MVPGGSNFDFFLSRLLDHIHSLLRNGQITERGLARKIGVSQPHIHNVLAGKRILTPALADRLLNYLNLDLLELIDYRAFKSSFIMLGTNGPGLWVIPAITARFSPSLPLPDLTKPSGWIYLPAQIGLSLKRPVFLPITAEESWGWNVGLAPLALLELEVANGDFVNPNCWYLISVEGAYAKIVKSATFASRRPRILAHLVWVGPDIRPTMNLASVGLYLPTETSR